MLESPPEQTAFENDGDAFCIPAAIVKKAKLSEIDEALEDVLYWLSRPPAERLATVTFCVRQMSGRQLKMDKSVVRKIRKH